ncbi:hypothetical protein EII20_10180 [Comamonadaceae bacterium OH2545_COT-014]|nr:hypothetical protein EII20_10180 [Comamonadaceae bacterium OH2545_COT-014]
MTVSAATHAAQPLPSLRIDPAQTSVSGVSSGGYMAVQLHVAYSATFKKGAGVIAAGPFHCAQGAVAHALGRCMTNPSAIPVAQLVRATRDWSASGHLDATAHLASSRVYLFSGAQDSVVKPGVVQALRDYYLHFVPPAQLTYVNTVAAEHAMVTDDHGAACATKADPYINDCDYDLAGAILQHLYGPLAPRNEGAPAGQLTEFDQTGFTTGHAMGRSGWIYVPALCASGQQPCRLHVALHGCRQNTAAVGAQYARHAGYNRWADSNRLVVLYPQTGDTAPNGCWDWWGYGSADYARQSAPQMQAIKAMVDQLTSGTPAGALPAPTSVAASATHQGMTLDWPAVAGALGYHVYRNGARATAQPITATRFTDRALNPGTPYRWRVKTVDAAGHESGFSPAATASTTGFAPRCHVANNVSHVLMGRAYALFGYTFARGSNEALGLWNVLTSTTLRQTGPGHYRMGTCY